MSVSQFLIASYWLLDGNFKRKWTLAKSNKVVLFFVAAWLIHAIGLLWSDNLQFGIHDLRIKLPMLLLPVFAGTLPRLTNKQIKTILISFLIAVFTGTMISMAVYLGFTHHEVKDIRDISIFISHIRFSLLINVAIIILIYFLRTDTIFQISSIEKKICIPLLIWFVVFLFILESFTGIVIFFIIAAILVFLYGIKNLQKIKRIALFVLLAIFFIIGISYIYSIHKKFFNTAAIDVSTIDIYTKEGNLYEHNPNIKYLENGNYISMYNCPTELKREWNKRSTISYEGTDQNGQQIKFTLIRYLTSKGLRKDADGMAHLTNEDIKKIEKSISNYKYFGGGFSTKIYQFIWQIDCYLKGGNPSGHSLTQRLEYLKTASAIIGNNFWIGVGTGDLDVEFAQQYALQKSALSPECRLRAHNQYLTLFLTFGLPGFLLLMYLLIAPAFISKATHYFIFNFFILTVLLSMLNEDTFESQPGITFIMFFYVLFALIIPQQPLHHKKQK